MSASKYLRIKRLFDIIISFISLIVMFPLFLLISFLIRIDTKGPIIFKQKRVGIYKNYFIIYKFRTMKTDTPSETPTHLLVDPENWLTRTGKYLRNTSLDELPQLFNILRGDMSIIGPRPALWNQYDLIKERDKYGANDVPAGLAGWAQRYGRRELPIHIKAKLDGEYASNISLSMDIRCFFGTIYGLFKPKKIDNKLSKDNE